MAQFQCELADQARSRGDHATERRDRVTLVRTSVGSRHVGADRDPAWVGVLDDRHGRFVEVVRRATRRIGVDVVVVRHLLAVVLRGLRQSRRGLTDVDGSILMRVLAITDATWTSYAAVWTNASAANC